MIDELLADAGVPETLRDKPDLVIEYLCRKVIALSEQVGNEPVVLDEDRMNAIETRTYDALMQMSSIDVFSTYNKSYLLSITEVERVAVKSALTRFAADRNVDKPEHWM